MPLQNSRTACAWPFQNPTPDTNQVRFGWRSMSLKSSNKKPGKAGFVVLRGCKNLFAAEAEIFKLLVEAGNAAAAIEQLLGSTCPCGMGGRINIKLHFVAFFAPSRTGCELRTIGHDDGDCVVVRMDIGFHNRSSQGLSTSASPAAYQKPLVKSQNLSEASV